MNARILIALLMGLALQAVQILPAAIPAKGCPPAAGSCDCCAGAPSCPCLDHGDPAPRPLPALPDGQSLGKGSLAPPSEAPVQEVSAEADGRSSASPALAARHPLVGYPGVRLSVAFCSFVI